MEFKGVGCMEPHTPESMTSSLYIVQEFMSGDTLKVQCCAVACAFMWKIPVVGQHNLAKGISGNCAFAPLLGLLQRVVVCVSGVTSL